MRTDSALHHTSPATKYGRVLRLCTYAQAADQHVWVGGLWFMGRVCGVLLNSCVGQEGGAPGHEQAHTLRFRASRWAACERCTGHALCSAMLLPYSTVLGTIGTLGPLMVLLTGDLAAFAAGRCCRRP